MSSWVDKNTSVAVKAEAGASFSGMPSTSKVTYTYYGDYGVPLSVGKTWSYEMLTTPSAGLPMTMMWNVEVAGIEEVTVSAGTFNCYKMVQINESGSSSINWVTFDNDYLMLVKTMNEASWIGTETWELVSYAE